LNPKHNSLRHPLSFGTLLLGYLLLPVSVSAEIKTAEISLTGTATVEELLRLESRAALEAARRQVFGVAPGSAAMTTSNDLPELVAIYGSGRNLSAELLIAGRTVIYHGRSKQSVNGMSHGYALERISPPCVYLKKDQSQQIACMELRTP